MIKAVLYLGLEVGGARPKDWRQSEPTVGRLHQWQPIYMIPAEGYWQMNKGENRMSQRGNAVPEAYYQRSQHAADQDDRVRESLLHELRVARHSWDTLRDDLSALEALLHVVSPDLPVQEEVHDLSQGCVAASEASTSLRSVLVGRARAAERRETAQRRGPS